MNAIQVESGTWLITLFFADHFSLWQFVQAVLADVGSSWGEAGGAT